MYDILNQQRVDVSVDGKVEGYAMEDAIEEPRSILFTIKPEELFFGYTKYQYRISAENAQLEAVTLSKEKEAEIAVLILNYESELARVELLAKREGVEVSKLLSRYQDLDLSSGATRTDKEKVRDIEYNTVVHYFEARLSLNEALTKLTDATGLRIDAVSLANSEVVKDEIEDRGSNVMGKLRKFEQSQMANWSEYVKTHPESVIHAGELDKAVLAAKAARWQFKQLWAQVGMRDGEVTAKAGLRARLLGDAASHRRKREAVEQEAITVNMVRDRLRFEHDLDALIRDYEKTSEQVRITYDDFERLSDILHSNRYKITGSENGTTTVISSRTGACP